MQTRHGVAQVLHKGALTSPFRNAGTKLKTAGNLGEGMARYLEAVDVCPAYAAAYYNQGVVHSERGRLDAATASYRRAVELLPAYAEAWCNLGVILRSQVRSAGDWQGVVWRSHERL